MYTVLLASSCYVLVVLDATLFFWLNWLLIIKETLSIDVARTKLTPQLQLPTFMEDGQWIQEHLYRHLLQIHFLC